MNKKLRKIWIIIFLILTGFIFYNLRTKETALSKDVKNYLKAIGEYENPKKNKPKIFILGLDGASFNILLPYFEEGKLPNLYNLYKGGVHANLSSTIPPESTSGWSSFATGKQPGKTGIFGCCKMNKDLSLYLTNSNDLKEKTIWQIASENGKKVVSLFPYLTFPPPTYLNGIMITGPLSEKSSPFTYPPILTNILKKYGYEAYENFDTAHPIEWYLEEEKKRAELAKIFLHHLNWDMFIFTIYSTDRIQHRNWKEREKIKSFWIELDKIIGEIFSCLDKNTSIVILSDHGFSEYNKGLDVHAWLVKNGFAEIDKNRLSITKMDEESGEWLIRPFDMKKSRVYTNYGSGANYFGLKLNLKVAKDEKKIENELIKKLKETFEPDTGKKVIKNVYRKEEIFKGDKLEEMPDIIVEMIDNYHNFMTEWPKKCLELPITNLPQGYLGHRRKGIMIMKGPHFRKGVEIEAEIVDLAPTILYLMDLPVAQDMDGRVLKEAINEEYLSSHPIKFVESYGVAFHPEIEEKGLTQEQIKRLKSLGYLQ